MEEKEEVTEESKVERSSSSKRQTEKKTSSLSVSEVFSHMVTVQVGQRVDFSFHPTHHFAANVPR